MPSLFDDNKPKPPRKLCKDANGDDVMMDEDEERPVYIETERDGQRTTVRFVGLADAIAKRNGEDHERD